MYKGTWEPQEGETLKGKWLSVHTVTGGLQYFNCIQVGDDVFSLPRDEQLEGLLKDSSDGDVVSITYTGGRYVAHM